MSIFFATVSGSGAKALKVKPRTLVAFQMMSDSEM
jgi:hypothetical protein